MKKILITLLHIATPIAAILWSIYQWTPAYNIAMGFSIIQCLLLLPIYCVIMINLFVYSGIKSTFGSLDPDNIKLFVDLVANKKKAIFKARLQITYLVITGSCWMFHGFIFLSILMLLCAFSRGLYTGSFLIVGNRCIALEAKKTSSPA